MTREFGLREAIDDGGRSLCFGHRRLAIIDTSSAGHQPMLSADGRYVITFGGEIYNYRELREELKSKGRQFRTGTDTEVLLNAFATTAATTTPAATRCQRELLMGGGGGGGAHDGTGPPNTSEPAGGRSDWSIGGADAPGCSSISDIGPYLR